MTIIKTFDNGYVETSSWRKRRYLLPVGLLLVLLMLAEIWANNTLVTYGEKFESISRLRLSLEIENQVLENKIAKESALSHIATESATLGFSQVESIQYIR
ncbi:hypothetical protein HYW42_03030 [Candidatus Daviesbacteria bacterium]|nr:hypothetical protein [Candidatus Daviesbacteria bacterium]